jgi:hypothetical protein
MPRGMLQNLNSERRRLPAHAGTLDVNHYFFFFGLVDGAK